MKDIVIYIRCRDNEQTEQSIEQQLKACDEYAEKNGLSIFGIYIDRANSSKADTRPSFQRMIADSGKNWFQGILVSQLDRFSRNMCECAHYKHLLKEKGVSVISATETFSDNASGILVEAVLEGMIEWYSADLSAKIKRGIALKKERQTNTTE